LVQSTIVQSFGKLENSAMDSGQQQYTTFSYLLLKKQFNDDVISYYCVFKSAHLLRFYNGDKYTFSRIYFSHV
jgi:hypothetical protein